MIPSGSALSWSVVLLAALVVAASAAPSEMPANEPATDLVFVASQTRFGHSRNDVLYIHRITPSGIVQVYTEAGSARGFGWSDAHTLWVLHANAKGMAIAKLVDGKPNQSTPIAGTDWKLPVDPDDLDATLHVTNRAGVWIEKSCPTCATPQYLRVDVSPFVQSMSKPKLGSEPTYGFAATKAPAGYAVKLVTHPAQATAKPRFRSGKTQALFNDKTTLSCSGPGETSLTWPDGSTERPALHPRGVTWVRASPPLVRITGKRVQPNGDVTNAELFILDCKDVLDDALSFGGGYWAAFHDNPTTDGTWTIYRDDKAVGSVLGSFLRLAPH